MTTTTKSQSCLLGKLATYVAPNGLRFPVEIIDAKFSYGVERVKIVPAHSGTGAAWVNLDTLLDVQDNTERLQTSG